MGSGAIVAILFAALATIVASVFAARSARRAHADRLALRLALEREAAFIECARKLADAATITVEAVGDELDRALRAAAPQIDTVAIFEEEAAQLQCVRALGERIAFYSGLRLAFDDPSAFAVRALNRGHRVTLAGEPDALPLHPGDRAAVAVPLNLESGRRGVVVLGSRTELAGPLVDRLVTIVEQAAPAYRIAQARDDDRLRAEFDALTGLLSARAFRERFSDAVGRARHAPHARLAVLFIDSDHFKAWNDQFGHASGDALLRELARILRAAANEPGDLAARNGGDEFCLVFADCEKTRAIERARVLCDRIAGADLAALRPANAEGDVHISASIGVAAFPADAEEAAALLEGADAAMYHTKRTGRNGVSYAGINGTLVRLGRQTPTAT